MHSTPELGNDKKMGTEPMVLIFWHDAYSISTSWVRKSDIEDEGVVAETIGWMLEDETIKGNVCVAQSRTSEGLYDSVLAIPVGMVEKIVFLQPPAL